MSLVRLLIKSSFLRTSVDATASENEEKGRQKKCHTDGRTERTGGRSETFLFEGPKGQDKGRTTRHRKKIIGRGGVQGYFQPLPLPQSTVRTAAASALAAAVVF